MNFIASSIALATVLVAASAADAETYRFYHPDALGSNVLITNRQGTVIQRTVHRPYGRQEAVVDGQGEPRSSGADSARNLFTGHELDPESDLIYFGARHYDPVVGKFLSVDPELIELGVSFGRIAQNGHNLNGHVYALNQPTLLIDPTGRFPLRGRQTIPDYVTSDPETLSKRDIQELKNDAKAKSEPMGRNSNIYVLGDKESLAEALGFIESFGSGKSLRQDVEDQYGMVVVVASDQIEKDATIQVEDNIGLGSDLKVNMSFIFWNPRGAAATSNGQVLNPAEALTHELGHAAQAEDILQLRSSPDAQFGNRDERGAHRYEAGVAGESGGPVRTDRGGWMFSVPCVTCR